MADLDKEFVEYVVRALVSNPDAVQVNRSVDDMGVLLELTVDPADMGKVIGKAGATAKSIRTLLRVLGSKGDERVNLKIVEPEGSERPAPAYAEAQADTSAPSDTYASEEVPESAAEPITEEPVLDQADEQDEHSSNLQEQTKRELADLDFDL
jgi:predicted RNA-binding protein YlqC (UPF0109 family)